MIFHSYVSLPEGSSHSWWFIVGFQGINGLLIGSNGNLRWFILTDKNEDNGKYPPVTWFAKKPFSLMCFPARNLNLKMFHCHVWLPEGEDQLVKFWSAIFVRDRQGDHKAKGSKVYGKWSRKLGWMMWCFLGSSYRMGQRWNHWERRKDREPSTKATRAQPPGWWWWSIYCHRDLDTHGVFRGIGWMMVNHTRYHPTWT